MEAEQNQTTTSFVNMEAEQNQVDPNTVESVLKYLKMVKDNDKSPVMSRNIQDLLSFMCIVILKRNHLRSKNKELLSLKRIFLDGKIKVEEWETILLGFLNDVPREQGLPWTEEEKEVWRLVLFFVSEQVGGSSYTNEIYYFMLEDQGRRAQLSPFILQLKSILYKKRK